MSSKNNTEVIIDGKIYILSGYETEEYLQKVAIYINNKMAEYKIDDNYRRQSLDVQRTLLELNIADDYYKAKKQADLLESDIEEKDKQLYDLKHELISAGMKIENFEKEVAQLKNDINNYEKDIVRLETTIKDLKEKN